MPDQHHNPPSADTPHDQHVVETLGYEARDIIGRRRSIFFYAGFHFVGLVVVGSMVVLLYWIMGRLAPTFDPAKPGAKRVESTAAKLQGDPFVDMKKFTKETDARMHSYGWVDQEKGIVHIPIEKAIEITAGQNLPHRGGSQ